MYDTLILGGTVIDGTGAPQRVADVAITDGVIVEIGTDLSGSARSTIDARGAIVTPGWVDIHTHYDGQAAWDDELAPSSMNGVTTVVMGNCGVGFAPVAPGNEQVLVELMEGVEDIPGAALYEGVPWGAWESFPEYLDFLDARSYSMDIGTQIPHGALRYYVMGDADEVNADASADQISRQAGLVAEAIGAGALGFSSSRTIGHQALWGEPVPGTFAADEELTAIASAMRKVGRGVIEVIPASTLGPLDHLGGEQSALSDEIELLRQLSETSGRPVTFTLVQYTTEDVDPWRPVLDQVAAANAGGAQLFPQVPARPISLLSGLSSYHAFMRKPTYLAELADLPLDARVEMMRDPEVRSRLMTEESVAPDEPGSMDNLYGLLTVAAGRMVPLDDPVDYYDPSPVTIGGLAAERGVEPLDALYDFLIGDDGLRFARIGAADPAGTEAGMHEMLVHEATVTGLSDAGAHVTMICDGSMPTSQLIHWARDSTGDLAIAIEALVAKQTRRNAELYGLVDRGAIVAGLRADINVIDLERLAVGPPDAFYDLPAGGTRLIQPVTGYVATMCNGVVTRRHDQDTGARPGRLVRSS